MMPKKRTLNNPTLNNPTLNNPTLNNPTLNNPTLNNPTLNNPTLNDLPQDLTEHSIGEYLTEEDKSTLTVVSKTTQALFQPDRLQKMANKLLLQVMHGEQEKAAKILKLHPELLTMTGTATDYSGRTFETTAFRYALWALDTRYMCNMMLDCLPYSEEGEVIKQALLTQYRAQARDGLDYKLNGVTIHETHYDFSPIKAALQIYIINYTDWEDNENLDAMTHQWSRVVGLAQRYVPAHVAQHYCDPDESFHPTPSFNKKTFVRSLEFHNDFKHQNEFWFAPFSPTSGLGVDFGILRLWSRARGVWAERLGMWTAGAHVDLAALTALCKVRTGDLVPLRQRLECPIQKPDARQCVIS
jgi:hypothetical protein